MKYKILILFIILLVTSSCSLLPFYRNYLYNNLLNMIKSDPSVSDVKIYVGNFNYYVRIEFKNGGSLEVDNIDSKGRGSAIIRITQIDDYDIEILTRNGLPVQNALYLQIFSAMTGVPINNVMDIVSNYNIFRQSAERMLILDDYRINFDNERWIRETLDRVIIENMLPTESIFIFEGQEYYLIRFRIRGHKEAQN